MAGLTARTTYLKNLRRQARQLTSVGLALTNLFAEEASQLKRRDEASRLKALYSFIKQHLERVKRSEDAASYSHTRAALIFSVGGLALSSAVKMVSKDKHLSALAGRLLGSPASKERPFGMVRVCIGSKGMPNDAGVVSISELARQSNREESEVISELQKYGYLLLSEKAFSLLIDRLVDGVLEGRLRLPISSEKLTEIKTASNLEPEFSDSE